MKLNIKKNAIPSNAGKGAGRATKAKTAAAKPVNTNSGGGYNNALDKVIARVGTIECKNGDLIEVGVYSYNGAPAKVGWVRRGEEFVTAKIGRISGREAVDLGKLITEAGKIARKHNIAAKGN